MQVERIAAFSEQGRGGNPAGVVIADALPGEAEMQRIAADVGYSETAFVAADRSAWRVRYFSPAAEVPFCGHATIALGAALARRHGAGVFPLRLNQAGISVEAVGQGEGMLVSLQSPPTRSAAPPALVQQLAIDLLGIDAGQLDPRLPCALIHAGADHLLLGLRQRDALASMHYEFEEGQRLMRAQGWVTISLVWAETARRFHARNAFASGGVYEDPATGAAAAALAGYLRDLGWPHGGAIEILQGEDMGVPSRLQVQLTDEPGSSVRVSGSVRWIE